MTPFKIQSDIILSDQLTQSTNLKTAQVIVTIMISQILSAEKIEFKIFVLCESINRKEGNVRFQQVLVWTSTVPVFHLFICICISPSLPPILARMTVTQFFVDVPNLEANQTVFDQSSCGCAVRECAEHILLHVLEFEGLLIPTVNHYC